MRIRNLFGKKGMAALMLTAAAGFISADLSGVQAQTPGGYIGYILERAGVAAVFFGNGDKPDDNVVLATETWTGGDNNDGNWSSNGNWSGVGGAGADDSLVFPQTAARKNNVNNFAVNTSFNSLNFTGGSYDISGNQIFLANGIDVNIPPASGAGPNFEPNIILGGDQTWNFQTSSTDIRGVVNLNNRDLTVITSASGSANLFNTISGTGTLTKAGPGRMFILGNGSGFGTTFINNGTAVVIGSLGNISFTGSGTVAGTGSLGAIAGGGGSIAPGHPLAAVKTGILTANGNVTLLSAGGNTVEIKINGGTAGTEYDRLVVNGNVSLGGAADLAVTLPLGFVPATGQQFTVVQTTGAGHTISGQFAQGTTVFANGRRFSVTYNSTSIVLTAQQTTYTWDGGGAGNTWSTGSNWDHDFSPVPGQNDVLVFPAGVANVNAQNDLPANSAFGSILITGNGYSIIESDASSTVLTGGITENAPAGQGSGLRMDIKLGQAQTFTANGLGNFSSPISFGLQFADDSKVIDLNGFALTLDGVGRQLHTTPIVGSGGLIKNGTGGVKLVATNTFTGGTQINNGVLEVSGTLPGTATLNGGTLGGSGATGPVTGSGGIAPGALAGTSFSTFAKLRTTGNVTLGPSSRYEIQIGGILPDSQYDDHSITGSLALGSGSTTLQLSLLNGFNPSVGQQFTIIQASNGVTGTFTQGTSITTGGKTFTIIYNPTSVVLEVAPPTAAGVEISGRVLTAVNGRGVRNAVVTLIDSNGQVRNTMSGPLGFYKFEDVEPGETYMIGVRSRRFAFEPQTLSVFNAVTGFDLVALQ